MRLPFGPNHVIDLRLDLLPLEIALLEVGDLDFAVEMADVANDGVVLHLVHVLASDDIDVAGGGDEDVAELAGVVHGDDLEAFHARLQGADRINLGDVNGRPGAAESLGASLADIAVAAHDGFLAGDHDVGGPLDAVDKRFAAAVEVVELALGDAIVDVDGGEEELAFGWPS